MCTGSDQASAAAGPPVVTPGCSMTGLPDCSDGHHASGTEPLPEQEQSTVLDDAKDLLAVHKTASSLRRSKTETDMELIDSSKYVVRVCEATQKKGNGSKDDEKGVAWTRAESPVKSTPAESSRRWSCPQLLPGELGQFGNEKPPGKDRWSWHDLYTSETGNRVCPTSSGQFSVGGYNSEGATYEAEYEADFRWLRMIDPVKRSRRVDTKKTVASRLLGEGSGWEARLFALAVKNWRSSRILWSLWVLGVVCGLLAMMEWVPLEMVWCSLLMLPLPSFTALVLSIDLVKEVLEQFEFYLITVFQVLLALLAVAMLQDRRGIFWFCFLPSMFIACLVDAYPPRYRRVFSVMFFTAMELMIVFWGVVLASSWIQVTDELWHIQITRGRLLPASCSLVVTLNAFCLKHLYVALRKPDHFVLIVGAVRTMRVQVRTEMETRADGSMYPTYMRVDRQLSVLSNRTIAGSAMPANFTG